MILQNKRVAIFNIANKYSIAWAVAQAMDQQGAELILGVQNERARGKVEALLGELSRPPLALIECDVTIDSQIEAAVAAVERSAGEPVQFQRAPVAAANCQQLYGLLLRHKLA